MPIVLAGRQGKVRAAVIQGSAPFLLSRPALKRLKAQIDFDRDELRLFEDGVRVPLKTNEAGQHIVPLMNSTEEDVLAMETQPSATNVSIPDTERLADVWEVQGEKVVRVHRIPRTGLYVPDEDCPVPVSQLLSSRCTLFTDKVSGKHTSLEDDWRHSPSEPPSQLWVGTTTFQVMAPPEPSSLPEFPSDPIVDAAACQWTRKQWRSLRSSAKQALQPGNPKVARPAEALDVIEVFSPPRFAKVCATKGLKCLSADLVTGWDFRNPVDRDRMRELVCTQKPRLLVLCPPCTWAGVGSILIRGICPLKSVLKRKG